MYVMSRDVGGVGWRAKTLSGPDFGGKNLENGQ
jgi:hypothetical protein